MSTMVPQPGPKWRATGQIEAELDTAMPGQAVPSQRVYFELTDTAVISDVLIPNTRLSDLAFVNSQIDAKARQLAAIAGLSSG